MWLCVFISLDDVGYLISGCFWRLPIHVWKLYLYLPVARCGDHGDCSFCSSLLVACKRCRNRRIFTVQTSFQREIFQLAKFCLNSMMYLSIYIYIYIFSTVHIDIGRILSTYIYRIIHDMICSDY